MTITAKFASRGVACGQAITPGTTIEWAKGCSVRHTSCEATSAQPAATTTRAKSRNWDPTAFAGRGGYPPYRGRPRGGDRGTCSCRNCRRGSESTCLRDGGGD